MKKLAIHFGSDASQQVDSMLERQNANERVASRHDFQGGAIGYLGGQLPEGAKVCFFTGTPINGPDIAELTDADAARRLFPTYDGPFAGVFWDCEQQTLVIASDCLGMQPLYMRHANGELTLVSETKALCGEPDPAAWGAFISIGHPIGDRSLLAGLERVPPATILIYRCSSGRLDMHRYWEWPGPSDNWRYYDFLESLGTDIEAYAETGDASTMLLSGGFDSRLLHYLLQKLQIPADALIVAHDDEYGDADGRLAEKIARLTKVAFERAHPPADFFSSAEYIDYLCASDVGFPSLNLFIAKVASHINASAVWDGLVPGFIFMPLRQPQGGFETYLEQEIKGPGSDIWKAAELLFKPEVVESMRDGFAEDLRQQVSQLPQDRHGLARFVIENRSRNRAAMNPLKVYANYADAYIPGLSKDFMAHAATIPFEEKVGGRFYRKLLSRLDKQALTVPFMSGGALLKERTLSGAYYRERLRVAYFDYRKNYPSLFPHRLRPQPQRRSSFVGDHLFADDDQWLDPNARDKLNVYGTDNHIAWKLLFHWKAWRWLHEGRRVDQMLNAR